MHSLDMTKKSIIDSIKEYMKLHQIKEFNNFFFEEIEGLSGKDEEEYSNLIEEVEYNMWNSDFPYMTSDTDCAMPLTLWIDQNDKLTMTCALLWTGEGGITGEDEKVFNEDEFMDLYCVDNLNNLLQNIQDERFYRLNELVNQSSKI